MNLFQLVFKQMRQRALGTWLTLLSVTLGMALAVAVLLMLNAGNALFGQTEYGFDVLVGIGQGSPLQLVLNTVYHIDKSPGNVPYWVYADFFNNQERPPRGSKEFDYRRHVKSAIPIAVGDSYKGRPIIGTPPKMFVSVDGLKERLDSAIESQSTARQTAQENAVNTQTLAGKVLTQQQSINAILGKLKEEMQRVEAETTPFVEHGATDPTAAKQWKYGRPAILDLDTALKEAASAAAKLTEKNAAEAMKSQQAVMDNLETVRKAVGFESGPLEYQPDMYYELAEGRVFHAWKFEAVIGSEVAKNAGLKVGSKFQATHGMPNPNETPDIHDELWQVVGVMKPTHTAADRGLYIPMITFYCIAEHDSGATSQLDARQGKEPRIASKTEEHVEDYEMVFGDELDPSLPHNKDFIALKTPPEKWQVSAIMVKSRGGVTGPGLSYQIQNGGISGGGVQAVNPAQVMQGFFDTFFKGSTMILLIISALVSVVAAIGILVSIYNSVAARIREIAILRALGATRGTVLSLICLEAGMIGFLGGILGIVLGHMLGGVASWYMNEHFGQGFNWIAVGVGEVIYWGVVVVIAVLAGFVPAIKAYRTPVATNLVAG